MKKISTFKSPEITSASRNQSSPASSEANYGAEFEPEARIIQNILNYSKAVQVQESALVGDIIALNN
ncbi:MAG TPA: hypothetical protein VNZ86_08070 [Bacteroidia bacterium]|jgi:hypothetical protein|nr:hypothetical protein [Bacteroidia bacterium]